MCEAKTPWVHFEVSLELHINVPRYHGSSQNALTYLQHFFLAQQNRKQLKYCHRLITYPIFLLGFETARSMALHGCCVVFACRSEEKATQAIGKIKSERPTAICHYINLNLESLQSVENFVSEFKGQFK